MPIHHRKLHDWAARLNDKTLLLKEVFVSEKKFCALRPFYVRGGSPSKSTLQCLVAKFETTVSVNNQPTPVGQRKARSEENIAAVYESVQANPGQSIPRRAQKLGFSQTSTWRILHSELGLHPYKI